AMSARGAATPVAIERAAARCDIDVVAIGASAGGVTALPIVLSTLAADFPAAVMIVLHLNPHHRSYLTSVLARTCRLPVREPASAEHSVMPSAAYATGCADFSLPLTRIGPALADLVPTPRSSLLESGRDG